MTKPRIAVIGVGHGIAQVFAHWIQSRHYTNGTFRLDFRSIQTGTGNPLERRNSGLNSLVW